MQFSNKIQISNIEIIFIDDDGFALGYILNKNKSDHEIEIPFDKTNIEFEIGDHLLVELEFFGKKNYKFKNCFSIDWSYCTNYSLSLWSNWII